MTGLMLAQKISQIRAVTIFEKSRGVGGRIATRRTDRAKFDHGAQFYRLKEPLADIHKGWIARSLVNDWFTEKGERHFNALGGMTALAKDLAENINVVLNERVSFIQHVGEKWIVTFESGRIESTDELVFTCPAPQTLEILKTSGVGFPSALSDITYTKALVVLFEDSPVPFKFKTHGYIEPERSLFFSLADQTEKKVSPVINALTATLGPEPSEALFDTPDDQIIFQAVAELKRLSPGFEAGVAQVKKWRYCMARKTFGELFTEIGRGLYLAGDGFGGASLNGAARSARALSEFMRLR